MRVLHTAAEDNLNRAPHEVRQSEALTRKAAVRILSAFISIYPGFPEAIFVSVMAEVLALDFLEGGTIFPLYEKQ